VFLITVGLNYRTAPVEIREKLAFPEDNISDPLQKLRCYPGIAGCAILSTCNRTEIYAAVRETQLGLSSIREFLAEWSNVDICEINNFFYTYTLYDAIHHLFRVTSGLDSMVLGESQILGQVRTAYRLASEAGTTNAIINTLFQQSISVGKRVRTETDIDKNAVSISYAAVELAKRQLGSLDGKTIMIVGAGKMSELTAKHLVSNGVTKVLVTNRSFDKAEALAGKFGGEAVPFEQLFEYMALANIVISCTSSPKYIIRKENIKNLTVEPTGDRLFMIDIAVPRDIEPEVGLIDGINLYDIDDLQNVVDRNLEERKKEAVKAKAIINEEIKAFLTWLNTQFVKPTIMSLKQKGEEIRQQELEKALKYLNNLSPKQMKAIDCMTNSIVKHLLHDPIIQLKSYASGNQGHMYAKILQNFFKLEVIKPEEHSEEEAAATTNN